MLDSYIPMIEIKLQEILKHKECEYSMLKDAMRYSASAGGKRIRPALMMEFCRVCGCYANVAINFACALEMIHTYSLIHDDLPCMDDDDMRRGKPSCHIAFGEANALLAGDALLTDAFRVALSTSGVSAENVVKAAKVLSECAGVDGMIGGQVIDLKYEESKPNLESVVDMYRMKTGALLVAAAKIGCILAGASEEKCKAAEDFALNLGLAFQIKDDILDMVSTTEELGKPVGSDSEMEKSTYVSFVGLEQAEKDVEKYTNSAILSLGIFGSEAENLKQFAINLINRKN